MNIPLARPDITDKEINAVVKVLRTSTLSLGPKLEEFEQKIAAYIGAKYAIAVNSGTSALHLCVRAIGIQPEDEIITTPFSFVASSNCVLFESAKPIFVDIREDTLNIDESKIEEKITAKTKAIIPVHVFGYPADMKAILKIAKKHNLKVIEDSCEAIGASVAGKKVGGLGDCGVFAFYPNKQMTTGEGGMIVTNSREIADLARSMRNQGRDKKEWLSHNRLGYNYRLSDINCALGVAQLSRIDQLLLRRDRVAKIYDRGLSGIEQIELPVEEANGIKRSWFVYVIRLKGEAAKSRDKMIELLRSDGIGCNVYFPPIHLQPFYVEKFGFKKGDFSITEKVAESTIALPFFNKLSQKEIEYVIKSIKKNLKKIKNGR